MRVVDEGQLIISLLPQIRDTIDVDDARRSYSELFPLNPGGIVPSGPTLKDLQLEEDPGRGPRNLEAIFHMKQ